MASNAREGCQPVRQTSPLPGPPTDGSVGHVSRGEQKAQTASQQCPGTTASACEGLIEQGNCDRVPRNNGVEADRDFPADLITVMDSSQRVWASTFYSLPSVLSTCGWTVPYLASNVGGGDCGVFVI